MMFEVEVGVGRCACGVCEGIDCAIVCSCVGMEIGDDPCSE